MIQVDIDGLSRSIFKGKRKKCTKRQRWKQSLIRKTEKSLMYSSQDGEYNDDISDTKVLSLNVLLQIIIL